MLPLLTIERRRAILRLLESEQVVAVPELAERFGVSSSTIRRDLTVLSREAGVRRTRGGALALARFEPSFEQKRALRAAEKAAIARLALRHVRPGQSLLLDAGTTTLELARLLARHRPEGVTVATNSVPVALELGGRVDVILTGGSVKERTLALVGPLAERALERLHADVAFLGINGVSPEAGFTTPSLEEAAVKAALIRAAREVVVLADSSKLGQVSFAHVAQPGEVDLLISDEEAPEPVLRALRQAGLRVELAPVRSEEASA